MNEPKAENLSRWIAAGLVAGAVVVGIAIAAYAVGYHRGEHHARNTAAGGAATTTAPTTSTATPTTTAAITVAVTPALLARGNQLYSADGCSACHSLTGAAGAGPSFKGLAGGTVTLDSGQTVTADDTYLEQSITQPDAQVVKGYHAGIMGAAVSGDNLGAKPDDVRALVAFIKSKR